MQTYDVIFGNTTLTMPWWWLDAFLIWMGLMGLIAWLFGRRLVRPIFALIGLVFGGLMGLALVKGMFTSLPTLPLVVVGAIVGAAIGFGLYRLGMGVVLAVMVAVATPVGLMQIQGLSMPDVETPIALTYHTIADNVAATAKTTNDKTDDEATASDEHETKTITPQSVTVPLSDGWIGLRQNVDDWWGALSVSQRVTLVTLTLAMAVLGLVLGIIFPSFGGAMVTSLVGTVLIVGAVGRLVVMRLSLDILPRSFSGLIVVIGVVTLIGALFQWTIFRPRTDK